MTSAKGMDKEDKGIGLDEILYLLDGRGFLRIKLGHSCVYRNLITHGYAAVNDIEQMTLFDWKSNTDKTFTHFRESEGTVITIIYPHNLPAIVLCHHSKEWSVPLSRPFKQIGDIGLPVYY